MILFTSGMPKSGKTIFAKKLIKALDNKLCLHINPSDYYPDDFEDLPYDEKTEIAIAAWELSLEKAIKSICAIPNRALIIFDTCCSKLLYMRQLFLNSKMRGHYVFMVFVDAPLDKRIERTKNKKLVDLEERYKKAFKKSLPVLKSHANEFILVKNGKDESESELDKYVQMVCNKVKNIRSG